MQGVREESGYALFSNKYIESSILSGFFYTKLLNLFIGNRT